MCQCNENKKQMPAMSVEKMVAGAIGITKNVLQVDIANKDLIANRRLICDKCENVVKPSPEAKGRCSICSCYIVWKTRLAGEKCPVNRW